MSIYSFKCNKCSVQDSGKLFNSFKDFQNYKCPKCGSEVSQIFKSLRFKIKGYCYENSSKGDSMYRDIGKEQRKSYSHE